jgi:hypothetical protein
MLSTLLQNLQSLLSKSFVIGSFFPALTFWFLNGLMLFWLFEPFRAEVLDSFGSGNTTRSAFLVGAALVGIALFAYALSAMSGTLRSLLEGKWWDWLSAAFVPAEAHRFYRIEQALNNVIALCGRLDLRAEDWKKRLKDARTEGSDFCKKRLRDARTEGSDKHPGVNVYTGTTEPAAVQIRALHELHLNHTLLQAAQLEAAVTVLEQVLRQNDANAPVDGKYALDDAQQQLVWLIDRAVDRARDEHFRLANKHVFNFGTLRLAPTMMGNIADTVQSYAANRYRFNLEVFWSRLQKTLQKDEKFYLVVQDAKTQLDFLIACAWLTALWTAVWTIVLGIVSYHYRVFPAVALGGPVLAYVWYRVAVEHYRAFADVLRTAVDLFRFDLLKELRLAVPADVVDEWALWESLTALTAYSEEYNFRYEHPKPS